MLFLDMVCLTVAIARIADVESDSLDADDVTMRLHKLNHILIQIRPGRRELKVAIATSEGRCGKPPITP
jgi:hypothetical protein